jgi:hypothetical protein
MGFAKRIFELYFREHSNDEGTQMRRVAFQIFFTSAALIVCASQAEAKRYVVKATAVCTDCGPSDSVPFQTTGAGYPTKQKCEKDRREIVATGKKNGLKITARCVLSGK